MIDIIIPIIREKRAVDCIGHAIMNAGMLPDYLNFITEIDKNRIGAPMMVKRLVERSTKDLICFLGDDCLPQENWLANALRKMSEFEGEWGLVGLNDGLHQGRIATHWVSHRKMLDHLNGEFFHTGYWHCYCDVELTERAKEIDRYKFADKSMIKHIHPLINPSVSKDPDYERVYSPKYVMHDRMLYYYRRSHGWR